MTTTESTEIGPADVERDERRELLLADLRAALGDMIVEHHLIPGLDLWIRVRTDAWPDAVRTCRDEVGLDYFDFLSGLDWMIAPWGRYENTQFDDDPGEVVDDSAAGASAAGASDVDAVDGDASEVAASEGDDESDAAAATGGGGISLPDGPGHAGGAGRFQLLTRLFSIGRGVGVNIKVDLDDEYPEVPTISSIFAGADWHERVTYEMYGFTFIGHPHLAKFYLPTDFEGFPLRKDFPLLSRVVKPWPGVVDVEPIPEHLEAELERAVMEAAEAEGTA